MKITTDFFKQMIATVKKGQKKQIIVAGVVLLIVVLTMISCGTKDDNKTASSGKAKAENGKNVKSEWQVYNKVDQFGDTTDETVLVLKNQKGTYSSAKDGSKDAKLEWEMRVVVGGAVDIILKEKGKEVSLSTLDDPLFDEYTITVKDDNGKSHNFTAEVVRNSDIFNVLEMSSPGRITRYSFQGLLAMNTSPKIVISSDNGLGSYSLGIVKTEGFEELAFKKSILDEAGKLIVNGELEKAKEILKKYSEEEYGYEYYVSFEDERNYYASTVDKYYSAIEEEVNKLLESGRYEDAMEKSHGVRGFKISDFGYDMIGEGYVKELLKKHNGYSIDTVIKCNIAIREGLNEKCIKAHTFDGDGYCCSVCGFSRLVGDIGPAGGFIFYDCDADNDTGNEDGLISSECGWRYLEAAPEDLPDEYVWGDEGEIGTQTGIGTGKANTEKISATRDGKTTAAKACLDYSVNGYDDWFLPSINELYLLYCFVSEDDVDCFDGGEYWSSTGGFYTVEAEFFRFRFGDISNGYRGSERAVRPCRAF